jgi:hypothetical protein
MYTVEQIEELKNSVVSTGAIFKYVLERIKYTVSAEYMKIYKKEGYYSIGHSLR